MNLPERETLHDQQKKFMSGLRMFGSVDDDAFSLTSQSEPSRDRSRRRLRTSSNPPIVDASILLQQHGIRPHSDTHPSFEDLPLQDLDFVLARVHAAMSQPIIDEEEDRKSTRLNSSH